MTPVFWKDEAEDKVPMLEEVDVDIDGRAHIGQQTGHVTRAFCNIAFDFLAFHFYTSVQNQKELFYSRIQIGQSKSTSPRPDWLSS